MTEPATHSSQAPIPVAVLTGFLGSGKTTLLNQLVRDTALANAAIIINEFGEIGLDHLLVESADEGILEMSSGCLCCSIRGDLVDTLNDLLERRDDGRIKAFDRVVIETTGLADPAPILHTIMSHPYLVMRYRLDGVIATVDAVNGLDTLESHGEAVKQAAVADRIVLTKTDLCRDDGKRAESLEDLKTRLGSLNPAAKLIVACHGQVSAADLFDAGLYNPDTKAPDVARWLREEAFAEEHDGGDHHTHHHDVNRHDENISAYCIAQDAPLSMNSFNLFMELLRANYGADLLRMKGIVQLEEDPERPVVIHGVQHVFHPPVHLDAWPDSDRRSRIVFITRNIPKEHLEGLMKAFAEPPSAMDAVAAFEPNQTLSINRGGGFFDKS